MVKLFSVTEMKAVENEANQSGLTYEIMMENAGQGIGTIISNAYSHISPKIITGLIGSGNNGGDTLVALEQLSSNKWETNAYIVRNRPDSDPYIEKLRKLGGRIYYFEEDNQYQELTRLINASPILIDGIFGTGIKLPLSSSIVGLLSYTNKLIKESQNKKYVVAVDCPSGVNCDTGEVAMETIQADITCTMAGMKLGLIKFPAAIMAGEIRFVSIGSLENLKTYQGNQKIVITDEFVLDNLPKRPLNSHKGTFGTAIIIAGSANYTGAAYLAGMAAYRIGAGLVTLAVPTELHNSLAGQLPEATWILLPQEDGVISSDGVEIIHKNLIQANAILIGPGIGLADTTKEFLKRFFTPDPTKKIDIHSSSNSYSINNEQNRQIPIVIDADGLKLLSAIENWPELLPAPAVLTPHPGEMSVLTGLSIKEIQDSRIEITKKYSSLWGHIVVLKGAFTVIGNPSGEIAVIPVATPALAKAGTGDVLAGMITGLLAQGMDAFNAACTAVWIHANAGLFASKQLGNTTSVMASDVVNAISPIISRLQEKVF
jgi:ADP-dependent NAD(P)H-hydrate dehydratase / NAD(P)H-hydrate epimerase